MDTKKSSLISESTPWSVHDLRAPLPASGMTPPPATAYSGGLRTQPAPRITRPSGAPVPTVASTPGHVAGTGPVAGIADVAISTATYDPGTTVRRAPV